MKAKAIIYIEFKMNLSKYFETINQERPELVS
jgi:hypothetical protein